MNKIWAKVDDVIADCDFHETPIDVFFMAVDLIPGNKADEAYKILINLDIIAQTCFGG